MKTLLIDDHPLMLSALQTVIAGLGAGVAVVGVGSAGAARLALAADPAFDLVLLDLQLGDADGFELLSELRSAHPALAVVVVSASERSADVLRAIDLGAMGFIPKCASHDTLAGALQMVMSGGIYLPPTIMRGHAAPRAAGTPGRGDARPTPQAVSFEPHADPAAALAPLGLTPRQTDVLALLLKGMPNKLIARELNLSVETVKDHVAAVLRSLNVRSRTQAVVAIGQLSHGAALSAWHESRRGVARHPPVASRPPVDAGRSVHAYADAAALTAALTGSLRPR